MTTISVGFGADAVVDEERFEVDDVVDRYTVHVDGDTATLKIRLPGRVRFYAPGFWRYVDVDDTGDTEDP